MTRRNFLFSVLGIGAVLKALSKKKQHQIEFWQDKTFAAWEPHQCLVKFVNHRTGRITTAKMSVSYCPYLESIDIDLTNRNE